MIKPTTTQPRSHATRRLAVTLAIGLFGVGTISCGGSDTKSVTSGERETSSSSASASGVAAESTTTRVTTTTAPPPTSAPAPPPAATTQPPTQAGVTLAAARELELPVDTCGLVTTPGVRLTNGVAHLPDGETIELAADDSTFADLTNNGTDDAVLVLDCDGGGVHVWRSLIAQTDSNPPTLIAGEQVLAPSGLPTGTTFHDWGSASYDGKRFTLTWSAEAPGDGYCCPQFAMSSVGTIDAGGFHSDSTTGVSNLTGNALVLKGAQPKSATTVKVAACVSDTVMYIDMPGPDPEVALLQTKLVELGYNPGDIDGYFGPNTLNAVGESQAQYDNSIGQNGINIDDQAISEPVFSRLGILC